jgi:hypothetical protein
MFSCGFVPQHRSKHFLLHGLALDIGRHSDFGTDNRIEFLGIYTDGLY